MQVKEEEQLQIRIVNIFALMANNIASKNFSVQISSGQRYRAIQPAKLISNRNESGKSGLQGVLAGRHFNNMGRASGELDLKLIWKSDFDIPTIAYVELKTPKRFSETGYYHKNAGRYKKGDKKPNTNQHNLEDSQVNFINEICNKFNIPYLVACDEAQVFDFFIKLRVLKKL